MNEDYLTIAQQIVARMTPRIRKAVAEFDAAWRSGDHDENRMRGFVTFISRLAYDAGYSEVAALLLGDPRDYRAINLLDAVSDIIVSAENVKKAPERPSPMSLEDIPTMEPKERQKRIDDLLDAYNSEEDSVKRKQLENRIRDLSASKKVALARICAWCGKNMGEKPPFNDSAVSHGICEDCAKKMEETDPLLSSVKASISPEKAIQPGNVWMVHEPGIEKAWQPSYRSQADIPVGVKVEITAKVNDVVDFLTDIPIKSSSGHLYTQWRAQLDNLWAGISPEDGQSAPSDMTTWTARNLPEFHNRERSLKVDDLLDAYNSSDSEEERKRIEYLLNELSVPNA